MKNDLNISFNFGVTPLLKDSKKDLNTCFEFGSQSLEHANLSFLKAKTQKLKNSLDSFLNKLTEFPRIQFLF